jgi:hypothetical protein
MRVRVTTVAVAEQQVLRSVRVCLQHAKRTHHNVIYGPSGSTIFFSTLTHKMHDFRKKSNWTSNMFWFYLQLLSASFLILGIIQPDITNVKYPLFFLDLKESWIFLEDFWKICKYQISWKSVQWEPSSSKRKDGWTDVQTDITKLIVAFRNFAEAQRNNSYNKIPLQG